MQASLLSQEELNEVCDLDLAQRQRIHELHSLIGQVTYYTLLGVEWNANKKTIKAAYYERAAAVHPDKFFRKELGSFRKKMEDVFARLTEAMDVLTSDRRAEYDQTLRHYGLIPQAGSGTHPAQPAPSAAPARPSAPAAASPSARPSAPAAAAPSTSGTPFPRPRMASETVLPTQEELAARKQALARKLLGHRSPSYVDPAEVAQADHSEADSAVAALRARYEQGVKSVKQKEEHKYLEEAAALSAKKDHVGAQAALERGLKNFPKSSALTKKLAEVAALALPQLFERCVAQAQECDSTDRREEGARFWLRAADLRKNDHATNAKAAAALLKFGAHLKDAADCAKRATHEQPKNVKYRILLANIYVAAGLKASAKKEADAARELAPKDPEVIALQKRV